MKLAPECRSCLLKKVRSQAKPAISGEKELDSLIAECECMFNEDFAKRAGAADAAGKIHRICYARMGISDPYLEIKDRDNRRAADTLSVVSEKISSLHDALTAAVIGNAMDYGITGHTVADDLPAFFNEMFSRGLTLDDSEEFLPLAPRVVYFTDNCGELIFDMQFIRELKKQGSCVTVVVKDGPMLNDVTMREAERVGLSEVADVVYSAGGGSLLGTHPDSFPDEVRKAVDDATLLIAKGLANYESLTEYHLQKPVAYLLMIKCDVVARHVSEAYGRPVVKGNLVAFLQRPK